jgi:hypothetical protein
VFLGLFLTCVVALAITTILLLLAGHRGHRTSRVLGFLLAVAVAIFAGQLAMVLFDLPREHVLAAQAGLVIFGIAITLLRPQWNPIGQVFYGTLLASAVTYLSFAAWYTLFGGLSLVGPSRRDSCSCSSWPRSRLRRGTRSTRAIRRPASDGTDRSPNRIRPTCRRCRCRSRRTTSHPTC